MAEHPTIGMVLDCIDPVAVAPFWEAALEYRNAGAVDNYVLLVSDQRPGPNLLLQKVPEAKAGKNRMHIDIETDDRHAVVARLEDLGGRRVPGGEFHEFECSWIVMTDPEGNEFCVCEKDKG